MVRKRVSKVDSHIEKVVEVETSMKPSIAVDPNSEEMIPTILSFWVVAKYSRKTQKLKMPLVGRIEGDSFTLNMASDPYVQQRYASQETFILVTTTVV